MSRLLGAALLLSCFGTGSALAHPGAHHGMSLSELVVHLGTGWHLMSLLAVAAVGVLALVVLLSSRRQARTAHVDRTPRGRS